MTEIINNNRQAEEAYQRWRKKHPEEAAKHDQEWLEMKKDPLKFKQFMESKGFHFSMSDEKFVKEHERLNMTGWQRFWKWLRKKSPIERRIKEYRRVAILHACFAAFVLGLSFFNFVTMLQLYELSQTPTTEEIIMAWNSVIFAAEISAVSGLFAFLGLLMLILAFSWYSQSLELRIKELEKKAEQKS